MADLLFPLQFRRQYAGPLDVSVVFSTLADMAAYLSDPTRYGGQVATCNEDEGKVFVLSVDRTRWLEASGGSGTVTFPPMTRADLNDAATAGTLIPFAPYFIEDEDKVAVATGHSGYIVLQNEVITPCNPLLTEDGIELITEDGITLCIDDGAVPDSIPLQTADGLYLITEDGIQLSTDA